MEADENDLPVASFVVRFTYALAKSFVNCRLPIGVVREWLFYAWFALIRSALKNHMP